MSDHDAVAIVGVAAAFPGAADARTFWRNIVDGVDAVTTVPQSRWDPVHYDPASSAPDRVPSRRGGFLDGLPVLDLDALGVVPAAVDDAEPDQMLTLSLAADAIADSGLDLDAVAPSTEVIIGRGGYLTPGMVRTDQRVRTAEQLVAALRGLFPALSEADLAAAKAVFREQLGPDRPSAAVDLVPNFAASRVANRFDLGGAAYTVDAACASGLVAVDHAVHDLLTGRAAAAVVGAVHLCHDITFWSVFAQLGALSRSEQIRPFDRRADGLVIGEGGGVVVLERLADAERRGAEVYAVIRGTGVASDGRGTSLMRPSVDGQVRALEHAWRMAVGVDPSRLGLLEAHGTGTAVGDAAEVETMRRVFGSGGDAPRAVVGSVKSMIGHAMPAAGMAGLIKAALAVRHGCAPASLHCEEPRDDLRQTRFDVVAQAREWSGAAAPRVAAVNAFGFGGINAHVVLEQHASSARPPAWSAALAPVESTLLLSAATADELLVRLDAVIDGRAPDPAHGPVRLAVVDPTPERLARVRRLVAAGRPWRGRDDIWFVPAGVVTAGGRIAFVFPGVEPTFQPRVDDVARHLGAQLPPLAGVDASRHDLFGLGRSMVAVSRLMDTAVRRLGLAPDVVAGQSLGEWCGMIATGMVAADDVDPIIASLQSDELRLARAAFLALGCSVDVAREMVAEFRDVHVSHDNCPHQTIVCGPDDDIEAVATRARSRKVMAQLLPFRSGFHTPLFAPYLAHAEVAFAGVALHPARVPLWSATTCAPYPDDPAEIRRLGAAHLVHPVRFRELVEALWREGVRLFVQVGAGSLPGMIEDTLRQKEAAVLSSNTPRRTGLAQLRRVAAAAWAEGCDVRFDAVPGQVVGDAVATALPRPRRPLALATPLIRPRALDQAVPIRPAAATASDPVALELQALLDELAASTSLVAAALAPPAGGPPPPAAPPAPAPSPMPEREPAAAPGPRELRRMVRISVQDQPELLDHAFFPQPPGWPDDSDRFPVVPMTSMVAMMCDAAAELVPHLQVVAVEDVRALRWLPAAPPTNVQITAAVAEETTAQVRVTVQIVGHARATIVLAGSAAPLGPALPALVGPTPAPITAQQAYADGWLFHGPAYQGLRAITAMGANGIDGVIRVLPAPGAVLDSASHLMGLWLMLTAEQDRLALPTSIDRLALTPGAICPGDEVRVAVRVASVEPTTIRAEMELAVKGRVVGRAFGWEARRFDSDDAVWGLTLEPHRRMLAEPKDGGWLLAAEHWRQPASAELIMRRYLSAVERGEYERRNPRARRLYLLGRIAAKDAVRRCLWQHDESPLWPVEVQVTNDAQGRPVVHVAGRDEDVRVSIAHTPWRGVAIAAIGGRVGIDVERIEPRSDTFAATAFTGDELDLLASAGDRDEWLTRGWAAKEAVAKSTGTGLGGRPREFGVSAVHEERLLVNGHRVHTRRLGDVVVAWTVEQEEQS